GGVLAALGQAQEPLPAEVNHLADGVRLAVGALDVAEVDAAVPLDARDDAQEGGLEAGGGRGAAGRGQVGELRLGTAPAQGGPVQGNQHRPGSAGRTVRMKKAAPARAGARGRLSDRTGGSTSRS